MMFIIRDPAQWVFDITRHFPAAVQPGLYLAICLLLLWLLIRRGKPIWNALVRWGCVAMDLTIGLILLPEYVWTRTRRTQHRMPATLAVTGSPVAERALDRVAISYERHGHIKVTGRPPLIFAALFCVASLGLHWLMLRPQSHGAQEFAARVWGYWASFDRWTQHD
jgi:hypothetical protein